MQESELLSLTRILVNPADDLSVTELDALEEQFINAVKHPGGSDLYNYPENWGLGNNPTAEAIVKEALAWRPRIISMSIVDAERHPREASLFSYVVEVPHQMKTRVVTDKQMSIGDTCAIALSGCILPNGHEVQHKFVNGVFSVGEVIGRTKLPVGTEANIDAI